MEPMGLSEIRGNAPFTLPPLPYSLGALEPHISEKTLSFHYEKHHRKYLTTTNELIKGTQFESATLEQIISSTTGKREFQKLYNNAAQVWNHWFYWNCLDPRGVKRPQGELLFALEKAFGSYESFVKEFSGSATEQFGSGYAWLVKDGENLLVMKTPNAENPMSKGLKPIIAIDVWEHAYYLDYQNRRQDYVSSFVNKMVNWDFAAYNFFGE